MDASCPGKDQNLTVTGVVLTKITLASVILIFSCRSAIFLRSLTCPCIEIRGQGTMWLNSTSGLSLSSAACVPMGVLSCL